MKFKLTVILTTLVVTMGLLLGTSAAQAAEVIFDPEIDGKAIGIRSLDFEGTLYNVKFTSPIDAAEAYGEYPGQFDTDLSTFQNAADLVNSALNSANAMRVGAEGSDAVPGYRIGYQSEDRGISGAEAVIYLSSVAWDSDLGTIWQSSDDIGVVPYNDDLSVWAKFTEASKDLQVIFEGNTATGIRNLEVDGQLYDVEFRFDTAENIYGADPIFDFGVDDVSKARRAVEDALNSEPEVKTVGPAADKSDNAYSIGFSKWFFDYFATTRDSYDLPRGPWAPIQPYSIAILSTEGYWADFEQVPAP